MRGSENMIFLKNIEQLGKEYCERYLKNWCTANLENNWWEALKFFFSHSFMRGRRDKLSNEYYHFTIKALEKYFNPIQDLNNAYKKILEDRKYFGKEIILNFKKDKNMKKKNSIKHPDFHKEIILKNPFIEHLLTEQDVEIIWRNDKYSKKIFLNNDEDIMMVLDVLKFISENNEKQNIYKYLKEKILNSEIESLYKELITIRAIKDKIATFIIRDIVLMNEINLRKEDYKFAFPIDTWVIKIATKELGILGTKEKEIKISFIEKCLENNINPSKFAAGLWYLGFHSLYIALDCLKKIEIKSNFFHPDK